MTADEHAIMIDVECAAACPLPMSAGASVTRKDLHHMKKAEFVQSVYDNNQDVIRLLDQKITVLIAILGVMVAALISWAAALAKAWDDIPRWFGVIICVPAGLAAVVVFASIFCAGMAFLPRRPKQIQPCNGTKETCPQVSRVFWAHDIMSHASFMDYWARLGGMSEDAFAAETAFEAMKTAAILVEKFKWNGRAVKLFLVALSCWSIPILSFPYLDYIGCRP